MSPNRSESYPRVPKEHLMPFTSVAHELPTGETIDSMRKRLNISTLVPARNLLITEANIEALKSQYQFAKNTFTVGKMYVVFGRV